MTDYTQQEIERYAAAYTRLQKQLDAANIKLDETQATIKRLEGQNAEFQDLIKHLEGERDHLKHCEEKWRQSLNQFDRDEATIATLTAERDKAQAIIDHHLARRGKSVAPYLAQIATLTAERDRLLRHEYPAQIAEKQGVVNRLTERVKELEAALLRCDGINDNPAHFNADLDKHLAPFVEEIKKR